ncbi:MAG TPA: phosphatidate cytidylyltransferase [Chitinophagaceae bacterium]
MAFNWQTFKTRTLTAIIFVIVMLTGLLINQWTFFILFSIIHFGCWWEYLKLNEKIHGTILNKYAKLGLMLLGYGLMIQGCTDYQIAGYGLKENFSLPISIAGFVLMIVGLFQSSITPRQFVSSFLGVPYISLSLGLMMALYGNVIIHFHDKVLVISNASYFYAAAIIASLWINDTMAYIIGSLIGRTPMSRISPKKTWEGTLGGIACCVGVIFLLSWYLFHFGVPSLGLMALAAVTSIAGTLGDLLESKLKRMADVKDSGHIMPGHGGFLDRFDSLLLATPFVWLYIYLFMR